MAIVARAALTAVAFVLLNWQLAAKSLLFTDQPLDDAIANSYEIKSCATAEDVDQISGDGAIIACGTETTEIFLKSQSQKGFSSLVVAPNSIANAMVTARKLPSNLELTNLQTNSHVLPSFDISKFDKPQYFLTTNFDNLATFSVLDLAEESFIRGDKPSPVSLLVAAESRHGRSRVVFSALSLDNLLEERKTLEALMSWLLSSQKLKISSVLLITNDGAKVQTSKTSSNNFEYLKSIKVVVQRVDGEKITEKIDTNDAEFLIKSLYYKYLHVHPKITLSPDGKSAIFSYDGALNVRLGASTFSFRLVRDGRSALWHEAIFNRLPVYDNHVWSLKIARVDVYASHIVCFTGLLLLVLGWLNLKV